jgi:hypothetical protein
MSTPWRKADDRARVGHRRALASFQFRTNGRPAPEKNFSALLLAAVVGAAVTASADSWPPFLPARATFPPDVASSVERVWGEPTLSRTVRGRPASVPFNIYAAFVDTPDVTAAAARFLKLARYRVRALDADWFEADDSAGARGIYRVLVRTPHRRVMLSWGEHQGRLLGTIGGSALTVIDFRERAGSVDQDLAAYVRIDNVFAAALARLLIPIFGHLADRKLIEGFTVTAAVAEWAVAHPDEFCEWLKREPLPPERRQPLRAVMPACPVDGPVSRPAS